METLEAILTRRSVRRFTAEAVTDSQVETLLRAAMAAPSAKNEQPWHFVVIRRRALLDTIRDVHPYAKMLAKAPVAIAVCGDTRRETAPGYWAVDCSLAGQNLLLAAHTLGLGAVWLGVYPRPERMAAITQVLHLPEHIKPLNVIALGHPAEHKAPSNRYDPSRVHRDGWE